MRESMPLITCWICSLRMLRTGNVSRHSGCKSSSRNGDNVTAMAPPAQWSWSSRASAVTLRWARLAQVLPRARRLRESHGTRKEATRATARQQPTHSENIYGVESDTRIQGNFTEFGMSKLRLHWRYIIRVNKKAKSIFQSETRRNWFNGFITALL